MTQRWQQAIPFALIGAALVVGIFSGTIGRPPAPANPCADRLLPPKYYMQDCVVRVVANPPLSELNSDHYWWTIVYLFEKYPDLCRPDTDYGSEELFFIFYTECDRRFEITNDVIRYMKKRDKNYPYTEIDHDFIIENDSIKRKDGGEFSNNGKWIPKINYHLEQR